jgi:UDPglucose 6-dehydrogenase
MRVAVVGTGYVGLVSGVCLAAKGHDVVCVDINPDIVGRLNAGEPTIYEAGLPELLKATRASGRFSVTGDLHAALAEAEIVMIAVGTPSENGVIDLQFIRSAAREIGEFLRTADRHVSVVVKSTVVPGTTDTIVRDEIERASGKVHPAFGLGMNPEFLREGDAVKDFDEPDRIVLGYEDPQTLERLEALYAPWAADKVRVNTRTAELIKYANNALLATQISAINEIANLAAAIGGIDVMDVVKGVHLDKRWNPMLKDAERAWPEILTYLVPGCGFGGSCFPKDVQALRSQGEQHGLEMRMMNAVLDVNDAQPMQVLDIIERERGGLAGRRVLLLGLAFKPGTDDVRESASLKIANSLIKKGAFVTAHDPIATHNFKRFMGATASKVDFVDDWADHVAAAEVIVVATKWPDYGLLTQMDLAGKVLFDARRMFAPGQAGQARYLSIGQRAA